MSSVEGFVPDAGGFCSTSSKAFSSEHSLVLACAQVFVFWLSNLILLFFDQTTKSLYDIFFGPLCALIFLMLISVFASLSVVLFAIIFSHYY